MEQLKPPGALNLEGNLAENFKEWIQSFELYLTATGIEEKAEKVQVATFLHVVRDSSAVRRLFVRLAGAMGRQSALYKENSGFAAPTLGRHIFTFRGYRILFSIRNPYINRLTNHFSILFITILPSESGVTLDYSTIFP